ncbi:MAG: HAD-IA family hydrolase [Nocardioidaceae bacterium]
MSDRSERTTTTRSAVVWDIGAVILRWEPTVLVTDTILPLHPALDAGELSSVIFSHEVWGDFDGGRIDRAELAARAAAAVGLDAADLHGLLDGISAHLVEMPGTRDLVARVRAAGHRVAFLSNMPHMMTSEVLQRLDGVFDDGVFSCDAGWAKPEPEVFRVAEERLSLDRARTLFLDDRLVNVEAARAAGWSAEVFTDAGAAAVMLEAAGWL